MWQETRPTSPLSSQKHSRSPLEPFGLDQRALYCLPDNCGLLSPLGGFLGLLGLIVTLMKKKELVSLLREVIYEGVMDNLTTQLSRVIVNHIKHFGHEGEGIPDFKGEVNDLLVHATFMHYDGPLRHAGGHYDPLARKFLAKIAVPYDFSDKDLADFIPKFKNLIRHELEHYRQDQRSGYDEPAKGVHHTLPGLPTQDGKVGNNPYATLESTYAYLLRPREVEAWVMGMYKQAKTQKVPLLTVLQRQSEELAEKLPNASISVEDARQVADSMLMAWTDYARKRLPGVNLSGYVVQESKPTKN